MTNHTTPCPYCKTLNPAQNTRCIACGAPLGKPAAPALDLTPKVTEVKAAPKKPKVEIPPEAKKAAETADKLYDTALYGYALLWRTLSEVVAIAVAATVVGLVGGATVMRFWGILGGAFVGFAVGRSEKFYWWTLISAPVGALIGLGFSTIFWLLGWLNIPVFVVTLAASAAAVFRSRPARTRRKNFWETARPWLGMLGGLAFGILGTGLGWALARLINELLAR